MEDKIVFKNSQFVTICFLYIFDPLLGIIARIRVYSFHPVANISKNERERFRPSQFWWNFTNDAPNSRMKAGKQRNEAGVSSTKQSVIVRAEIKWSRTAGSDFCRLFSY